MELAAGPRRTIVARPLRPRAVGGLWVMRAASADWTAALPSTCDTRASQNVTFLATWNSKLPPDATRIHIHLQKTVEWRE